MTVIIAFQGRLAAQPNHTVTPNTGTDVTEAVVLVNRREKTTDGEWADAPATRYHLKAWKRRARALASLDTGTPVIVIGHVETTSWTDPDGNRHYRDTVIVDHLGTAL